MATGSYLTGHIARIDQTEHNITQHGMLQHGIPSDQEGVPIHIHTNLAVAYPKVCPTSA